MTSAPSSNQPSETTTDESRAIFHFFDRDADGKLNGEEFFSALLAGGAQLTPNDFENKVIPEFGSAPTMVAFKSALTRCRSRDESAESLLEKLRPFVTNEGKVKTSTLRYIVTNNAKECISQEEADELINLVDPEKSGLVNDRHFCSVLIP